MIYTLLNVAFFIIGVVIALYKLWKEHAIRLLTYQYSFSRFGKFFRRLNSRIFNIADSDILTKSNKIDRIRNIRNASVSADSATVKLSLLTKHKREFKFVAGVYYFILIMAYLKIFDFLSMLTTSSVIPIILLVFALIYIIFWMHTSYIAIDKKVLIVMTPHWVLVDRGAEILKYMKLEKESSFEVSPKCFFIGLVFRYGNKKYRILKFPRIFSRYMLSFSELMELAKELNTKLTNIHK